MHREEVAVRRDCEAIAIPQGDRVTVPAGTQGWVTQALGNSYTVQIPSLGGLFRIAGKDADAIGKPSSQSTPPELPEGQPVDEEAVWEQLRNVFDPEIPLNVVDLGLIYDLSIERLSGDTSRVQIKMTLTAPSCGMGPAIATDARARIENLPNVEAAEVEIVWDPPWGPHMISPQGRAKLGMD